MCDVASASADNGRDYLQRASRSVACSQHLLCTKKGGNNNHKLTSVYTFVYSYNKQRCTSICVSCRASCVDIILLTYIVAQPLAVCTEHIRVSVEFYLYIHIYTICVVCICIYDRAANNVYKKLAAQTI